MTRRKQNSEESVNEAIGEFLESQKEPEPAEPEPRKQKSWAATVRPWETHGRDTGVKHVTAKLLMGGNGVMDATGIQFERGKERTAQEKLAMEAIGLKFYEQAQSWLKPMSDAAYDETKKLGRQIADRRRQITTEYVGR